MVSPRVEVAPVLEKSDSVETVDGGDNRRAGSFILNRNHFLWTTGQMNYEQIDFTPWPIINFDN